jgi:hypothetical protein
MGGCAGHVCPQPGQEGGIRPWNPDCSAHDRLIHDTKRMWDRSILFIRIGQGHDLPVPP